MSFVSRPVFFSSGATSACFMSGGTVACFMSGGTVACFMSGGTVADSSDILTMLARVGATMLMFDFSSAVGKGSG